MLLCLLVSCKCACCVCLLFVFGVSPVRCVFFACLVQTCFLLLGVVGVMSPVCLCACLCFKCVCVVFAACSCLLFSMCVCFVCLFLMRFVFVLLLVFGAFPCDVLCLFVCVWPLTHVLFLLCACLFKAWFVRAVCLCLASPNVFLFAWMLFMIWPSFPNVLLCLLVCCKCVCCVCLLLVFGVSPVRCVLFDVFGFCV